LIRHYLQRVTGYSRPQLTRLIAQYLHSGRLVRRYRATPTSYARKFTPEDIVLLAEVDSLHGTLSGPATRVLLARACHLFGDTRYARLATISVAHLYNLRAKPIYQQRRVHFSKTQTRPSSIGVRRAPAPEGRPGFIRIDTVHQGDLDGRKGLYHINAVDIITQWQLVATCERISEAYLLPVIGELWAGFPFVVLGFHSDGGGDMSITTWPSCWRSYGSSSPARGRATPTTTPWSKARTAASFASSSATPISPNTSPLT
jgi:hypothetical protein